MKPNHALLTGTLLFFAAAAGAQDETMNLPGPEESQVPVAEQDLELDEAQRPTEVDDEQRPTEVDDEQLLLSEFDRFKFLLSDGSLDEADSVAKRIIEIAIRTKGARSEEMAKALTNLAIVQHRTEDFEAAQQNYETAIEIIEENEDRLNEQLVNPLKGLAAAQLESGRPDLATQTYNRAVHVTHVNEGPHNMQQISLLEDLAEVKLRMGDLKAAQGVQENIYALNVRAHRFDSLELIPALMRRAEWQHRAGLIFDERATYRRVIRIVQQKLGKEHLSLVEPLIRLGRSYFFVDLSGQSSYMNSAPASGEIYFKQALRIAQENPESDWHTVAKATLALGDYYMFDGNAQRARTSYTEVWNLLSSAGDEDVKRAMRRTELESTLPLKSNPLPRYVGEKDPTDDAEEDDIQRGTITISYDISERGRTGNVKLIEAIPPEFADMQALVAREIRRREYRPMFVDGAPVESTGHVFVHTYWYRQSDLDAASKASEKTETSDET
jgi:tetratricopeptide (TPR) repeat protein